MRTAEQRRASALKAWETMRARQTTPNRSKVAKPTCSGEETLLSFIHKSGGLDLSGLPLQYQNYTDGTCGPGRRPGLFRKTRTELTWEEMISEANDAGYGPFDDEREFFAAVEDELAGRKLHQSSARKVVYSEEDEWNKFVEAEARAGRCAYCSQHLPPPTNAGELTV